MALDAASLINTGASGFSAIGNYFAQRKSIKQAEKQRKLVLDATANLQQEIVDSGEDQAQQILLRSFAALQDATQAEEYAQRQASDLRRQGARVGSTVQAAAAASGLDLVGSPLLALGEVAYETERRAQYATHLGQLQSRQYRFEAEQAVRAARLTRQDATSRANAAGIQGTTQANVIDGQVDKLKDAGRRSLISFGQTVAETYSNDIGSAVSKLFKKGS